MSFGHYSDREFHLLLYRDGDGLSDCDDCQAEIMRTRDPMTLRLYRENRHVEPRPAWDVLDVVLGSTLLGVLLLLVVLVMGGL